MTIDGKDIRGPIAIDGPAAAGKTTIGHMVAEMLGWPALDTGLMYRAVGYLAAARGIDTNDDDALEAAAQSTDVYADGGRVAIDVDGSDVTERLMDPAVSRSASTVASRSRVRAVLVAKQRALASASAGRIVMVGRDIGTVVLPQAPTKIYLDAPATVRARRRHIEESKGDNSASVAYLSVLSDIEARDERDKTREDSPLVAAEDAFVVESGGMTVEEVVRAVLDIAGRVKSSSAST
jgi:cytidylate kinase